MVCVCVGGLSRAFGILKKLLSDGDKQVEHVVKHDSKFSYEAEALGNQIYMSKH